MTGLHIGLSLGSVRSSAPRPERLQDIVTDASATPTTTAITLGTGQNAVRVFTGNSTYSERYFDLYVRRNGGAAVKVRMDRWRGRILGEAAVWAAGDTIALGTTDGRTLKCAAMTVPTSLSNPSGATGTANCDAALPILWSPTAGHITLPSNGSAFIIGTDVAERPVFIREKSPSGEWTPARWFWTSTTRATVVRCNYTEIALANEAGATLSITAPTGSTIGGTSAAMSLLIPAVTGTTRNVTDNATFAAAIAAAVSGDEIVLAAGAYTTGATQASFTANEAAGKIGAEGILIRGGTGNKADVTISGDWTLTQPGAGPQATGYASFKDLTFDFGASANNFVVSGGRYYLQDVRFTNSTSDNFQAAVNSGALYIYALRCTSDNAGADCWNFDGAGGTADDAASVVQLIACTGTDAGATSADQCLTTHDGLDIQAHGGAYSDANTNVWGNGGSPTPATYGYFVTFTKGARQGRTQDSVLYGCSLTDAYGTGGSPSETWFCRVAGTLASSTNSAIRNPSASVHHNIITVTVGRGVHVSTGGLSLFGNIIAGSAEGLRLGDAASAVASAAVSLNTFNSTANAMNMQDVDTPAVVRSNAAKASSSNSLNIVTAAAGVISGDYNTLDPTVDAEYSAGANDTTGADAELDADYFPTASGNCDQNGDPALLDYCGLSDPYGFVLCYKTGVLSRGARAIPRLVSGATLHPDLF